MSPIDKRIDSWTEIPSTGNINSSKNSSIQYPRSQFERTNIPRVEKGKGGKNYYSNYRALTKRGRARGPMRLSINYTVIGYRGARLCGWTAPITSPWPGQRGLLPSPPLPRAQSHGTSLEGFECHSTIIIAARVMYHVIVHGDSAFARTEEEDATFRYPDPGLVHLSLFVPGQRQPYHIRFCCDGKSARASSPSLGRRKLRKFHLEDRFDPVGKAEKWEWEELSCLRFGFVPAAYMEIVIRGERFIGSART